MRKIDVAIALITKIKNFHEGRGKYNFSSLSDSDRTNEEFDAWQDIYLEINEFLRKNKAIK